MDYYLAFDLGAGSGRLFLGKLDGGENLRIKELHRFRHKPVDLLDNTYWDILYVYNQMLEGMRVFSSRHRGLSASLGIDTWGTDFALLDNQGNLLAFPFSSRDKRTQGIMEEFHYKISAERIYRLTGVRSRPGNTLYQLYSMVKNGNPQPKMASDLLFIADLLVYFLTREKKTEFTITSTSQLYNMQSRIWDEELFKYLGISKQIMQEVIPAGTIVGNLDPCISNKIGLNSIPIIAVASHDSASALTAVPVSESASASITCGTMSLMCSETEFPINNSKMFECGLSNYGGPCGLNFVIKSTTGLWLLQECLQEWSETKKYTYDELVQIACMTKPRGVVIDLDYPDLIKPYSMTNSITKFCQKTGQNIPRDIGEFTRAILESLALSYRHILEQLEMISDKKIKQIHIVGGGSKNRLLCQSTADATGLPVIAGPAEASIIGNILIQAMVFGRIGSLEDIREVVRQSFSLDVYEPMRHQYWDRLSEQFKQVQRHIAVA